jgi:hypothetical protein
VGCLLMMVSQMYSITIHTQYVYCTFDIDATVGPLRTENAHRGGWVGGVLAGGGSEEIVREAGGHGG